jgi:protein O-mannosyl-transferase
MSNKINIDPGKKSLIIYIVLTAAALIVFAQLGRYGFINFDDDLYVTDNSYVQAGLSLESIRWAFTDIYHAELWHPLTWLSLMLDSTLFGLNPAGFHATSLILHILSTLLLFWLFNRMTGAVWKSAFVAAFFALHPLRAESVAWIAERKDVLSIFFSMLTLCLYVYYTEKPAVKRYLLVVLSFACALMSKPIVVTLPLVMILLDYWPLKRFESNKANMALLQLREKVPLLVLSFFLTVVTFYAESITAGRNIYTSAVSRLADASLSFVTYLQKIFWPHDLVVFYPFPQQIPAWHVLGALVLIIAVSVTVIINIKRFPYLFAGWFWYAVTILPVLGITSIGVHLIHDRYAYLPSIGIAVMLAWGMPSLIQTKETRTKILFPAAIAFLAVLAVLTWQQCAYWKNSLVLYNHALNVTNNNFIAFSGRGVAYSELGLYQKALEDFNQSIRLKPDYSYNYFNRGNIYNIFGKYDQAIEDYNRAVGLKPDYAYVYINRGITFLKQNKNEPGCRDLQKACEAGKCKVLEAARRKGICG